MGRTGDLTRVVGRTVCELLANTVNARRKFTGNPDLTGKVVVITGANTGIGKITAKEIARRGAKVIIGCRDVDKGNNAIEDIKKEYPDVNIRLIKLDLCSLESVRQFAKQLCDEETHIDILINNAGVFASPESKTEDGFEMQFGTNHLGHFLLTMLLLDRIKAAPNARIVMVSSAAHMAGAIHFDDINLDSPGVSCCQSCHSHGSIMLLETYVSYFQSKLAKVLFAKELARRLKGTNITTYSLHPGIITTELQRHVGIAGMFIGTAVNRVFMISPELGAQTTLYCALDDSVAKESGYYYVDCKRVDKMTSNVTDESARKLWDLSCDLVGLEERLRLK